MRIAWKNKWQECYVGASHGNGSHNEMVIHLLCSSNFFHIKPFLPHILLIQQWMPLVAAVSDTMKQGKNKEPNSIVEKKWRQRE